MERFAFKIDKALKANLYKICRLCGMDNPEMVPILSGNEGATPPVVNVDGEPELSQKIQQCVGFIITKDDKMPQTMCTMCVDKINDFHEFREMCFATNIQTRKLLGLKAEVPKKIPIVDVKPVVDIKDESMASTALGKKNARKRKIEEANPNASKGKANLAGCTVAAAASVIDEVKKEDAQLAAKKLRLSEAATLPKGKQKVLTPKEKRLQEIQKKQTERSGVQLLPKEEIKEEPLDKSAAGATAPAVAVAGTSSAATTSSVGTPRFKQLCNICDQRFNTKIKLDKHLSTAHMPVIPRFYCNTCDETIKKAVDIKNHQLWHKLSKTPYICALCGESLISIYAFSRHLREHCPEFPTAALVLDRQCPQCQQTYATNFLYNTHPCAVRTKKCAGCNRKQSSETVYMTHSANCPKTYLNYSKHIPAAAVAAESCVRIKNENDVEEAAAAEALARSSGISLDLTPVVSLTRLPSPVVMAVNQCVAIPAGHESLLNPRSSKRVGGNKKGSGVSKKDFKRVDELLKSTIDALVSIKHEPEVHVETDAPLAEADEEAASSAANDDADTDVGAFNDDFHHGDDDDDDDDVDHPPDTALTNVGIKLEPGVLNHEHKDVEINIKKEIIDVDEYEGGGGGTSAKVPILKLKIKKEHGTLNSSLVNDAEAARSERKKNKKEKKKRKDTEKNRDKVVDKNQNSQDSMSAEQSICENAASAGIIQPCFVRIKQERFDDEVETALGISNKRNSRENIALDDEPMPTPSTQPEATVMTSIPLMQFQIACISSGVDFTGETQAQTTTATTAAAAADQTQHNEAAELPVLPAAAAVDDEQEVRDIKPNRLELDRMLQITNITSGVDMQTELETAAAAATETDADDDEEHSLTSSPNKRKAVAKKPKKPAAKAMKSTGGMARATAAATATMTTRRQSSNEMSPTMKILEVRSGVDVPPIIIKPEPCNRGYSDEQTAPQETMDCSSIVTSLNAYTINEIAEASDAHLKSNINDEDEQSYIAKIDFNNLKIKQEKDIEVSEVQLSTHSAIPAASAVRVCNGVKRRAVKRKTQKRKRKESTCVAKDAATKAAQPVEAAENADELMANHHSDEDLEGEEEEVENGEELDDDEEDIEEEEEEDDLEEEVEEEQEHEEEEEEAEQEVREYREMELPPLLATDDVELQRTETDDAEIEHNTKTETPTVPSDLTPTFVITNVCSHAAVESTNETLDRDALRVVKVEAQPAEEEEKEVAQLEHQNNQLVLEANKVEEHSLAATNCGNTTNVTHEEIKPATSSTEINCQLLGVHKEAETAAAAAFDTNDLNISTLTADQADLSFEMNLTAAEVAVAAAATTAETSAEITENAENETQKSAANAAEVKADTAAETATISGAIVEEQEATTKAQPFYEARPSDEMLGADDETNLSAPDSDDDDAMSAANRETATYDVAVAAATDAAAVEEHQNLLNHEMAAQANAAVAADAAVGFSFATAFQLHPYLEDITSSSGSGFSCGGATNDATDETASTSAAAAVKLQQHQQQQHSEETDNRINECADAALRQMQLSPNLNPHLLLDERNVNEIAENNNNANIERELLDDNNERAPSLNDLNAAAAAAPANAAVAEDDAATADAAAAACDRLI